MESGYLLENSSPVVGIIEEIYKEILPKIVREPRNFILSPKITVEVIIRHLGDRDLIEACHPQLEGSEMFKIAGYLTYWIAKLKPVVTTERYPDKAEIFINEYLAIAVANSYLYMDKHISLSSEKFIDELRYLLRYRTLTVRIMPIIYEAYFNGYYEGKSNRTREER